MPKKKLGLADVDETPNHRCVVLGSGGHARAVIEVLRDCDGIEICGCVAPEGSGGTVAGTPVLGDDDVLPHLRDKGIVLAFVAVGSNDLRRRLSEKVRESGMDLASGISPAAYLAADARMGSGVIVMPGAVVRTGVVVGDGTIINSGAIVDHDVRLGAWTHVGPGASVAGNVTIESGAFLGVGCCVIPGVTVGAWTVVGAGSVVVRDLPDRVIVVGSPARVIRTLVR